MRIEIDTKHDTKEELAHLANMLNALSASSSSGSTVMASRLDRKLAKKGLVQSAASEPAPSGDLFNLFNDDSPSQSAAQASSYSEPAQPASGTGDLFSLFNSEPPAQQQAQPVQQAMPTPANSRTVAELLKGNIPVEQQAEENPEEGKTSVKDILDDDRIVPY